MCGERVVLGRFDLLVLALLRLFACRGGVAVQNSGQAAFRGLELVGHLARFRAAFLDSLFHV